MLQIQRYRRFYALYEGADVFALCVYKKGAVAVKQRIEDLEARLAPLANHEG